MRGETYVSIALIALVLVSIGFLVVRGIVVAQAQQSLAAAQSASTASTPSKKDTLTPQCAAATKNNEKLAQYGVREDIRTQMPVEYNKSIKEATTDGFCKPEYKVKESWGEGCNSKKCPLGVTVFPPGTKLSPGVVQCSTDGKGFVVACRNNPDAQQPSKPDAAAPSGKDANKLAQDVGKTDSAPQGQSGGSQDSGNFDKVFGEQNSTAKDETSAIADKVAGAQERLDTAGKALDDYYDNGGKRGTTEETKLLSEYNDASKTKDQLIDEARYARADFESRATQLGTPSTAEELAQQNSYAQKADALGRLVDDYGAQRAGQDVVSDRAGIPYADPEAPNPGRLQQVDTDPVGASYYSCLQSQGSVCYGGDGARTSENRLRDGDIAITPQLRQQIGLRPNEIADVLLEGPNGNRTWATVRDEIGFGNERVPSYALGAGQLVQIDYFREPGRSTSSLMGSLGLTRAAGLQGNVRVVLVRRY